MCLIIANISPDRTSREILESSFKTNKDGAGVAYNFNGELVVKKGFKDFDEFYNYYLAIPPESNILIHHRLTSAGDNSEENLHPFFISDNLVVVMNGTLSDYVFKGSQKSDTSIFNDIVLKPFFAMDKEFYKKPFIRRIMEGHVKNAKFVFFNNLGEFSIWNEHLGTWETSPENKDNKSWFSNVIHKKKIEEEKQKKNKDFTHKNKTLFKYDNKTTYFVPNMGTGTPPNLKKKYYLRSDNLYRELSLDGISELCKKHHCGIKKLLKKYIIGKLDHVSPDKLKATEKARYDAYWKEKGFLDGDISSHVLNSADDYSKKKV